MLRWFKQLLGITDYSARPCVEEFLIHCPVCGYPTINREKPWPRLCQWDICPVCFWEDGDDYNGEGPNNVVSIRQARENYAKYGAMEQRHVRDVRPPTDVERAGRIELPDPEPLMNWSRSRVENDKRGLLDFYK